MSTRAIVAVPHGDTWRGRHTHSDGYPEGRGRALWALVKRDGVEKVAKTITEDHYGWSAILPNQQSIKGVRANRDAPYGTPEHDAYNHGPKGIYGTGQFVIVPGYGVAYTSHVIKGFMGGDDYQQSSEDEWLGPHEQGDTADSEWAYVLAPEALWVYKTHMTFGQGQEPITPTLVGVYRYKDPEPNWEEVSAKGDRYEDEEEDPDAAA